MLNNLIAPYQLGVKMIRKISTVLEDLSRNSVFRTQALTDLPQAVERTGDWRYLKKGGNYNL